LPENTDHNESVLIIDNVMMKITMEKIKTVQQMKKQGQMFSETRLKRLSNGSLTPTSISIVFHVKSSNLNFAEA
jgi:hypothetical protein